MAYRQTTNSGTGGHPSQILTPTEAHANIMEVVNRIRLLSARSMANEDLDEATSLMTGNLRRSITSRLWMLRSLWYAEPIRLVSVGQWMSLIDEEMKEKLEDLDVLIQHRISKTAHGCGNLKVTINDYGGSHEAKKQMKPALRGGDMNRRQQEMHGRTDQASRFKEPTSHSTEKTNGINTDTSMNEPSPTGSCRLPVGKYDLCNFGAYWRSKPLRILHDKTPDRCGDPGLIGKRKEKGPDMDAAWQPGSGTEQVCGRQPAKRTLQRNDNSACLSERQPRHREP